MDAAAKVKALVCSPYNYIGRKINRKCYKILARLRGSQLPVALWRELRNVDSVNAIIMVERNLTASDKQLWPPDLRVPLSIKHLPPENVLPVYSFILTRKPSSNPPPKLLERALGVVGKTNDFV